MAGPKITWFRRFRDYWRYFFSRRWKELLAITLCLIGILLRIYDSIANGQVSMQGKIGIIISIASIVLIFITNWQWNSEIRKMFVGAIRWNNKQNRNGVPRLRKFDGRPFLIDEDLNKAIRSRSLRTRTVKFTEKYKLHTDAKKIAYAFVEYFRLCHHASKKSGGTKPWNELSPKFRLPGVEDKLN